MLTTLQCTETVNHIKKVEVKAACSKLNLGSEIK